MPTLPPFTVHTLISQTKPVEDYYPRMKEVINTTSEKEIKEAITGEDGWVMVPVIRSTNIMEIGWKEERLRVKFKNMRMYEYSPIPELMWTDFLAAKSKGEFHSKRIKGRTNMKVKKILGC